MMRELCLIEYFAYIQDFYEDLFEELSKYGELESLNICDNLADPMVYIYYCLFCFFYLILVAICVAGILFT